MALSACMYLNIALPHCLIKKGDHLDNKRLFTKDTSNSLLFETHDNDTSPNFFYICGFLSTQVAIYSAMNNSKNIQITAHKASKMHPVVFSIWSQTNASVDVV